MNDDSTTRSLDRRKFLKGAGAAGVALATMPLASKGAWAGIAKKSAMKPLRIGNLLTFSGPNSAPSIDVRRGFVAYVYSHGHRIGGRKIQFFDADDANNPANAIQQVQKLVQEDQVDVIEGIFFSSVLLGVRDTIDQLQVPTIVANAAANAISRDRLSQYIYRTSYSNYQLGVPLGPVGGAHDRQGRRRRDRGELRRRPGVGGGVQVGVRGGGRHALRDDLHALPDDARLPALLPAGGRPAAPRASGRSRPAAARRSSSSRRTGSSASTSSSSSSAATT